MQQPTGCHLLPPDFLLKTPLSNSPLNGALPEPLAHSFILVRAARLELARLAPLPPQDSVSTNSTTSALKMGLSQQLSFSATLIKRTGIISSQEQSLKSLFLQLVGHLERLPGQLLHLEPHRNQSYPSGQALQVSVLLPVSWKTAAFPSHCSGKVHGMAQNKPLPTSPGKRRQPHQP